MKFQISSNSQVFKPDWDGFDSEKFNVSFTTNVTTSPWQKCKTTRNIRLKGIHKEIWNFIIK